MRTFSNILFFTLLSTVLFSQDRDALSIDLPIYKTDTIVWFGADFSLLRLSNEKKMGDEEKINPLLPVWVDGYASAIPNVKLASLLGIKKVINDKEYTSEAYKDELPGNWIVSERHEISPEDIEELIVDYESENKGIGLVYIVENFFKGLSGPGDPLPSKVYGYFVWFDIRSKEIIHIQTIEGTPTTAYYTDYGWEIGNRNGTPKNKGMVGYWLQGMLDATVAFTIEYKDVIPKEEKEY